MDYVYGMAYPWKEKGSTWTLPNFRKMDVIYQKEKHNLTDVHCAYIRITEYIYSIVVTKFDQ